MRLTKSTVVVSGSADPKFPPSFPDFEPERSSVTAKLASDRSHAAGDSGPRYPHIGSAPAPRPIELMIHHVFAGRIPWPVLLLLPLPAGVRSFFHHQEQPCASRWRCRQDSRFFSVFTPAYAYVSRLRPVSPCRRVCSRAAETASLVVSGPSRRRSLFITSDSPVRTRRPRDAGPDHIWPGSTDQGCMVLPADATVV